MKKLIFLAFFLFGCKTIKDKKNIERFKITKSEVYRKADTLEYSVPKAVFKDTTIYVRNFEKQGSNTLKIVYDKQGNQTDILCISEAIKQINETVESLKDKTKIKETEFNSFNIIYIFIGFFILLLINKRT